MKAFANVNPKDTREALSLLSGGRAAPVGGGSDLLGLVKEGIVSPELLVNLKSLTGLDGVEPRGTGARVGGLITLAALSKHPLIRSRYRVLAEAAGSVGTPQIRNVGTLAGNICQRPWCWYYRQGFPCFKNGGDLCFSFVGENQFNALFGGGPSYIVHPSDTAPALLALGARFRILGPGGEKLVPASEFFVLPEKDVRRENILATDEILTGVELGPAPSGLRSTYAKLMDREAWTHAVVSAAVALEMEGGVCKKAGLALGGVAPIPWPLPKVERFLNGKKVTPELAAEAGKLAVEGAQPLSKNAYKVGLTETLVRRTILSLAG
jgi:xanthine dehydrogenase YagS FAD-binding subunit